MCLYSTLGPNLKFTANKKNGGIIPPIIDTRTRMVAYQCGRCMECRAKKARDWTARLMADIKEHKNGKFVTLTFSNESLLEISEMKPTKSWKGLANLKGYDRDNAIAKRAVALFRERWRKEFKTSIRHWFVTELGHKGTENIHIHGIVWTDQSFEDIKRIWKYGFIWPYQKKDYLKNYVSEKTINYCTKYVTKNDLDHPNYTPRILTSPGMGKYYITSNDSRRNKYAGIATIETYKTRQGFELPLPTYWRNKIYTEEEREQLWIQKINKEVTWVNGIEIDLKRNFKAYEEALRIARIQNKELKYKSNRKLPDEIEREELKRNQLYNSRISKALYDRETSHHRHRIIMLDHYKNYIDKRPGEEAPF